MSDLKQAARELDWSLRLLAFVLQHPTTAEEGFRATEFMASCSFPVSRELTARLSAAESERDGYMLRLNDSLAEQEVQLTRAYAERDEALRVADRLEQLYRSLRLGTYDLSKPGRQWDAATNAAIAAARKPEGMG